MRNLLAAVFTIPFILAACQAGKEGGLDSVKSDKELAVTETELSESEVSEATADETDNASTASIKKPAEPGETGTKSDLVIEAYVPPKPGTVFTWRNNWANLPDLISYKVAGNLKLGNTEYIKFSSVQGFKSQTHAFYDTSNFSLKGYRDKSDRAVVTFKPPEQRYRFPMAPGDKWVTSWKSIDHKTDRVTSGGGVVRVLRWETLDLPAGRIRALKVRVPVQRNAPKGLTHHAWFSPKLGITVKEEIGGGILNWSQVLEKVDLPD